LLPYPKTLRKYSPRFKIKSTQTIFQSVLGQFLNPKILFAYLRVNVQNGLRKPIHAISHCVRERCQ